MREMSIYMVVAWYMQMRKLSCTIFLLFLVGVVWWTETAADKLLRFFCVICHDMEKKVLGLVTARGGSKSIPRKNIKLFLGRPLIALALDTLKKSGVCDRVAVSTDDREIADIAKNFGAEVPFVRPAELAQDDTPTLPVIRHAVSWLKEHEHYEPDIVVLLEPTSVGKRPFHVRAVVEMLARTGADCVLTVSEVPSDWHPHWQLTRDADARVAIFTGGPMKRVIRRRQDLSKTYSCDSAVFAFKPHVLFADEPSFYGDDTRGYVTEQKYAVDLDAPDDWEEAERRVKKILDDEDKIKTS